MGMGRRKRERQAEYRLTSVSVVRQDSVAVPPELQTTTYAYDPVGNLVERRLPNGTTTTYQYDSLDRATQVETVDSAGTLIASFGYTLRKDGRRVAATEDIRQPDGTYVVATREYSFDALGRLTAEKYVAGGSDDFRNEYVYDLNGNRVELRRDAGADGSVDTTTTYSYNASNRLLSQTTGTDRVDYEYDLNGSLTAARSYANAVLVGTELRRYDSRNRLVGVDQDGDGTDDVTYGYDDLGRRVIRTDAQGTRRYLIESMNPSGVGQVLEERDNTGAVVASYVHGFTPISQNLGGGQQFLIHDGARSTRVLTDGSEIVIAGFSFDAFGNLVASTGTAGTAYLFVGEWFDSASGTYNLRARDYDPEVGRFTQSDPLRGTSIDVLNAYAYANADPVNFVDPTGLFSVAGSIGGLLGGIGTIGTLLSIGGKTYAAAQTIGELLDLRDFMILTRKLTNAGILDYELFYEMQKEAFYTATYLISQAFVQIADLVIEVATSFSYGQVFSFFAMGGGDFGLGLQQRVENGGEIIIEEENGQASLKSIVKHHTVFKAAMKAGVRQPLFNMARKFHVGPTGIHTRFLQETASVGGTPINKLVPRKGYPMKKAIKDAGGPEPWLQKMEQAYAFLENKHAPDYDGITDWYRMAVDRIGGAAGIISV